MPQVLPFHGVRFNWRRVNLTSVLCPPYDVIPDAMARRLRKNPKNTIHVELPPAGKDRYASAARAWNHWGTTGLLISDFGACYYVIEQRFRLAGKQFLRTGFLSSLRLDDAGLKQVVPHEKTLAKPKRDRLKMLGALHAQTSPIFALYDDANGKIQKIISRITRTKPEAQGTAPDGVLVRVWRVADPAVVRAIETSFLPKRLLIADGHHRLEVSKEFGAGGILCYLCAEQDRGLVVLPTHRVLLEANVALKNVRKYCRVRACSSLSTLERAVDRQASPFAFGVILPRALQNGFPGRYLLAVPSAASGRGIKSGLGVEWLARRLFSVEDRENIKYTHESREAAELADEMTGAAFLVKPVEVIDIRKAVQKVGLLPQKSTYFFPKMEAGVVFHKI